MKFGFEEKIKKKSFRVVVAEVTSHRYLKASLALEEPITSWSRLSSPLEGLEPAKGEQNDFFQNPPAGRNGFAYNASTESMT